MTDRISYLTVALATDVRDDDVVAIVRAIELLQGVAGVDLGTPVNPGDWVERKRLHARFARDIWGLLDGSKRIVDADKGQP